MGPGNDPTQEDLKNAEKLGRLIAEEGWVLLTGGRQEGVMDAASKGAQEAGGLVIGVLHTADHSGMSEYVDIPIVTGMGGARNNINVLSSDVVIACGMQAGTASEVALAIKAGKQVILLADNEKGKEFFQRLGGNLVVFVNSPEVAVNCVREVLNK